jgi:hypothetical protein
VQFDQWSGTPRTPPLEATSKLAVNATLSNTQNCVQETLTCEMLTRQSVWPVRPPRNGGGNVLLLILELIPRMISS